MPVPTLRVRLRVTGTVQGVGFRPFVYRHAVALGLTGTVGNDSAGVVIEVEGPASHLAELQRILVQQPPPLACVDDVRAVPMPPEGGAGFTIIDSTGGDPDVPVAVDAATCADCLLELFDPSDRRYRYPFVNCTNCGPRYTIVRGVPYDRPLTTMAPFRMCDACRREYDDPRDRRFHAQPNACPACGPAVRLVDPARTELAAGDGAVAAAVAALRDGRIVAVKGLGGFHLAVDATNDAAVSELRRRKARDDKPFAVMAPDLAWARRLCALDNEAEAALTSPRRPIVLAARRGGTGDVAPGVAPGLPELGVLLPYTPLHHLLLAGVGRPLVMTSGNVSDEPIAHTDEDARNRLGPLADALLVHDRAIDIRCDDSVVRGTQVLRRSRGYAPEPIAMPVPARRPILAVGAELKSTVTVARGRTLVTSHHIGDLEHVAAYQSFRQAVDHLTRLCGAEPELVAHDLHPEYLSTKFAADLGLPSVAVQHHHAHVAACMTEHGRTDRVLGVAFDGLGLGSDGTLWGGEFLVADLSAFERVGHLRAIPLPGGTSAIREPWRMAMAWLHVAAGPDAAARFGSATDDRWPGVAEVVASETGIPTSSVGRLFDAVAALLGLRARVTYEGQAAIELEALAAQVQNHDGRDYEFAISDDDGGVLVLDPCPAVAAVVEDRDQGVPPPVVAARFHDSLATATARAAEHLAGSHGCDTVALTGGVFQNARLAGAVARDLESRGVRVLVHRRIPPNDGGISVGQAAVAACKNA